MACRALRVLCPNHGNALDLFQDPAYHNRRTGSPASPLLAVPVVRCFLRRVLAILSVLTVLLGSSSALADKRDLTIMPKVAPGSVPITGEHWALLVGIDKYRDPQIPTLNTAVKDAVAVRDLLIERYGFKADRMHTLLNEQATREGIEGALYRLGQQAGPNDSVFIYYAGHGQTDIEKVRGWWVPFDAKANEPATFIKNASVRDEIAAMKAKHVYLVADSCFSGTLFAQSRTMPAFNDKFFARLYQSKSRWGLTSGMNEPVADQGKGGHSIFAYFFLKTLRENEDPYLVPSHIYDQLAPLVGRNAEQQPRSEPLQGAGDEGGQFVFRLVGAATAKTGASAAKPDPAPSAARTQAEQELKALEAQERHVEEQQKLAAVQQEIERKKKQIEDKKKTVIEEARVRPPSAPSQMGRELTGKDGAPMLLVPAGEFLYGDNNQRMTLPAFYMDKYELTTSRYAKFLQEAGRRKPHKWEEVSQVSDGNRPVIGVTWHDADAYCRQYGKRLPTEQEWEKAARGTDGRKYPWGNEEPTSQHAKYELDGNRVPSWNGYATLATVESYESGRSPYGMYHMAGNVWEWTSSDYDSARNVIRGGSWYNEAHVMPSTVRRGVRPDIWDTTQFGFRCAQDAR